MRIATLVASNNGSANYRAFQPMQELGRRGHSVLITSWSKRLDPRVLDFDVAYFQRYSGRDVERTIRQLRDAGLTILWDHDDDVAAVPDQQEGALNWQSTVAETRTMIELADVVTTTNEHLAANYRRLGAKSVHVLENYLPDCFLETRPRPHDGLVLGWIAWADHQLDWNRLGLKATVRQLLDEHPDLRVVSVGPIELGLPRERYDRIGPVGFEALADQIAGFDIGIAPLADLACNRARSSIKLKEYANVGVPWLASPVGPYAALGAKQGGQLVPDDGWHDAIRELIVNTRLRRKLAKHGSRWAASQTLAKHVGKWEAALQEGVKRATARRSAGLA